MSDGWIKLHRKIIKNPRFLDGDWTRLWIWMLCKATHQPRDVIFMGKRITLQPGQFTAGRKQMAEKTGISQGKVWRLLETLKIEQQIEQRSSNACSLFTIVNWSEYQISEQQTEQRLSNDRATTEQRLSTKQEYKNDKNVISTPTPPAGHSFPTIEEVKAWGAIIGLPADECEKFWNHFESVGWIDRNGHPIQNPNAKLRVWKADFESKRGESKQAGATPNTFWADKARLDLIASEITAIEKRSQVDPWGAFKISEEDKDKYNRLRKERKEIKQKLGI